MNSPDPIKRKSKYRGVYWDKYRHKNKGIWTAHATIKGQWTYLGSFQYEDDAAGAYDSALIANGGDLSKLNFPLMKNEE